MPTQTAEVTYLPIHIFITYSKHETIRGSVKVLSGEERLNIGNFIALTQMPILPIHITIFTSGLP